MTDKEWLDFSLKCLYEDGLIEEKVKYLCDLCCNVKDNPDLKKLLWIKTVNRRKDILKANKKTTNFFNLLMRSGFEIIDNYFIKKVDLQIKDFKDAFLFKVEILDIYEHNFKIAITLDFPTKINETVGVGRIIKSPTKIESYSELASILNNLTYDAIKNYKISLAIN